jgi:hypothetical protein
MSATETFTDDELTLVLSHTPDAVRLEWKGVSMAREPAQFVSPILSRALDLGLQTQKKVVIDFQQMEYLNSSTLSPVIRTLEHARRGQNQLTVVYSKTLKWQALSFGPLEIFKTPDARISVQGV